MWKKHCAKALLLGICCWRLTAAASPGQEAVALRWAPTIDQFFNTAGNASQANPAQEDTSTVFNFDLDWRANNNWDNLNYYKLKPPAVYYSVAETNRFYFLGYYFYYPRHLGASPHGNDFTGLALAVEKAVKGADWLAGVLLYTDGGWQEVSTRSVDKPVRLGISAGSHELAVRREDRPPGGSVITCTPPQTGDGSYELVALTDMWKHRGEIQAGEAYGTLDDKTDSDQPELRRLPWKWKYRGVRWLSDPAAVFRLITGDKAFTGDYVTNLYN